MLHLMLTALLATQPVETDVTLTSQPAPLHGTLLAPEGPARAAAVIIPGSGPTNRNGDQPPAIRAGSSTMPSSTI